MTTSMKIIATIDEGVALVMPVQRDAADERRAVPDHDRRIAIGGILRHPSAGRAVRNEVTRVTRRKFNGSFGVLVRVRIGSGRGL